MGSGSALKPDAEQLIGPERREREVIADFQLPIVDLIGAAVSTQTFGVCSSILVKTVDVSRRGTIMETSIPTTVWLELQNREIDGINKSLDGERKNRGKREFILVLTCLLALLYTYPLQGFQTNPNIDIPSISLHIPLRDALGVFPTLIAAIYLVYLSSAISESILMSRQMTYSWQLRQFKKTGAIPPERPDRPIYFSNVRYLLLPTPLHRRGFLYGAAEVPRAIVDGFVGLVFTLLPYATMAFIVLKSWKLIHYKTILIWNIICLVIMMLAFLSALLGSRQSAFGH